MAVVSVDSSLRRIFDNRLVVTGLLLLVGPLGLPALWLNRRFSLTSKVLGTVGFVLLTVVFPLVMVWYWCQYATQPVVDAFVKSW